MSLNYNYESPSHSVLGVLSEKELKIISRLKPFHFSTFDLFISKSGIINSGFGVFTKDFIPKDTLIDKYYGKYINGLYGGDYYFRIDDYLGIDALDPPRCYMAFLNDSSFRPTSKRGLRNFIEHNFTNNCKFQVDKVNKKVEIYSIVDIDPGSELFISYGNTYWNSTN
jgi:hypothetical protein